MTVISNNNIAHAIYLTLKDQNHAEQALFFKKIINFLVKKRLLSKAPNILFSLNKIINDNEKRIVAKVSSARKIDETINKKLARILAERYSAEEVNLVENLDKKLIGGFKIEVNDEIIDLTIKNKIGQLQEYLTSNI